MKRRYAVVLGAMACVVALGLGPVALAATTNVSIGDNFYSPATVNIAVGDSVVWTHNGQAPHSVTADDGSFDSSPGCPGNLDACMQSGDTYSHAFPSAGTFSYFCTVHGQSMSGTVVVESSGTTPPPTSPGPSGTLPNTGAGSGSFIVLIAGAALLLAGGGILLGLRRGRA